jgi:four helix bundle protein
MAAGLTQGAKTYRDLLVWQKGMDLCTLVYRVTKRLPKEETYGLTSQIRRSAVSVPSNIAEGFGRDQTGSFVQYLRIAQGSLKELETQLLVCQRVEMLMNDEIKPLLSIADEIGRMLRALIRSQKPD